MTTSSDYALQAEGLTKRFGDTQALAGIDLAAREGTVLGVLGPNGAGKTTAVRILATLIKADAGRATVCGYDVARDPQRVRQNIGLTGQYASVDEDLTGTENLVMIGQLLDMTGRSAKARARELLEWFDLTQAAARPAKTYSGGMRRRLDLAASLVGRPRLVFLDEPTTGLDPAKREDMWGVVRSLVDDGSTVLLTTQYLEEADALADDISVIDHGRVIAQGTPDELKRVVGGQTLTVRTAEGSRTEDAARILAEVTGTEPERRRDGQLSVSVRGDEAMTRTVAQLATAGIGVTELSLHLPSLDEVFFSLTGRDSSRAGAAEEAGVMTTTTTHPTESTVATAAPAASTTAGPRLDSGDAYVTGSGPLRLLRHSAVLARRGLLKTYRTPEALIDVTIQPVIFLLLFVYLFGGAITGSRHDYLQFVLPGLLVQSLLFGSVAIGVNLNTDIDKGVFDRFRSLPIARSAPLLGAVLADVTRYLILSVVLVSVGYGMGFRIHTNPGELVLGCLLAIGFALCLCWLSVVVGLTARSSGSVQGILFLALFPLTFGSNVFVGTSTLPGWLQAFVKVNPTSHLTSAVRGLFNGGPVLSPVLWTFGWMALLLAVFFPLALRAYRRRT